MSDIEKIKKIIERCDNCKLKECIQCEICWTEVNAIKNVLSELQIKDKMIDKMAEYLADMDFDECCAEIPEPCLSCSWEDYEPHTNCIKEHFRNEVLKDE